MGHGARNLGARLGFGLPGDSEGLMGRTVVAAMVGGLSSKITGGTFANGAMTATFVHLFNAEGLLKDRALSKHEAELAANSLDENVGFETGFKEGLISIGKGLHKAISYGGSYWASKACSTWSSECAATHQLIRDEGGNIGLVLYDLTWTESDNVSMVASESITVGGYIGGRVIGAGTVSSGLTTMVLGSGATAGTIIGVGFAGVVAGGNMLSASEMYGSNLSGSQLLTLGIYGK